MKFIDTNVLVYFGEHESQKSGTAASVLTGGGVASVQVLNELANVLRRKNKLAWDRIRPALNLVRTLVDIVPLTVATHDGALRLTVQYNFHFYDALIVASALECGCDTLLTEDMHHGLLVENRLTIVNPFA